MSTQSMIPIPAGATSVLVFEQFAHLDWDWLNCFPTNVDGTNPIDFTYFDGNTQPANTIYTQAGQLLQLSSSYYYATCEIGFLRAFGQAFPDLVAGMIATGRLRIVGGGITSPDSLLSSGEAFFRNYLVGLQWMQSVSLPWTGCVWVPDDFGHDSQLPVQLAAMGAQAVGFARCPLATAYQQGMTYQQPAPTAGTILPLPPDQGGGLDFIWIAADGSQVFAHWMPDAYSQGSTLYDAVNPMKLIQGYLDTNTPGSPTPYVHVPVSNDFSIPLGGGPPPVTVANTLLEYIGKWNTTNPTTPAVLSTFDQYVASVLAYVNAGAVTLATRSFHGQPQFSDATTFRSNPYWMGFYASRMNIKSLHHQAVRALLAAETLDAILAAVGSPQDNTGALFSAWNDFVPSTHHDYITGTAEDEVVAQEQMPLLEQTLTAAQTLITSQLDALAAAVVTGNALVVYNPLGIPRTGALVEIGPAAAQQLSLPAGQWQDTADGNVLVYVAAPSAGYETFTTEYPPPPAAPTCTTNDGGKTYTLSNGIISATVAKSANWALTGVIDVAAEQTFVSAGNELSFYQDSGNIYEFGYECNSSDTFALLTPSFTPGPATVTENGPLRATLSATISVTVLARVYSYTLHYSLVAGEPFLRMSVTGQAPSGTSMFVSFLFGDTVTFLEHGTPYHWDFKTPATFGQCNWNSVFEPTHDFVSVYGAVGIFGAIYHQAVPAWAINGSEVVGAILRNTPSGGCDGRGAQGSDNGTHVIEYALRIPTGLADASTGQPLQEARAYNTPLYATMASASDGNAPDSFSLAGVAPSSAMVTAVKRGSFDASQLFVRVYQPENVQVELTVTAGWSTTGAVVATALEQSPASGAQPVVSATDSTVSFKTQSAVTTLQLPG